MADKIVVNVNNGILAESVKIARLEFVMGKGVAGVQGEEREAADLSDIPEAEIVPETREEAVKKAIEKLASYKDENGEYLMRKKNQWYGVYRILVDRGLCEPNFTQFEEFVNQLNIELREEIQAMGKDLCKYQEQVPGGAFEKWAQPTPTDTPAYRKIYPVAAKFKEFLDLYLP